MRVSISARSLVPLRPLSGKTLRSVRFSSSTHIGIFGGSFNPPQRAHFEALRYVHNLSENGRPVFDQVWVVPTYRHAFGKDLLDYALRHHLCRLMIEDLGNDGKRIIVKDTERRLRGENRTVQTLRYYREEYPGFRFSLILGADLRAEFPTWLEPEEILRLATLFYLPRAGYDNTGIATPFVSPEIASTQIRRAIQAGEDANALMSPGVAAFVRNYALYRPRSIATPYEEIGGIELVFEDESFQHRHLGLYRWGLRNHYPDGQVSQIYFYETVLRPHLDAVGVLLYSAENPQDPTIYMRRTLRPALAFRDHATIAGKPRPLMLPLRQHPVVLGFVAGILEEGETSDAARRVRALEEIHEEAGFRLEDNHLLSLGGPITSSVGITPEFLYPFAAPIVPEKKLRAPGDGSAMEEIGGLVSMTLSEAIDQCVQGRIRSALTEICLHRFANLWRSGHARD